MKNKVINFYGCSFSDGGGLDNSAYTKRTDQLNQYRRENRFST